MCISLQCNYIQALHTNGLCTTVQFQSRIQTFVHCITLEPCSHILHIWPLYENGIIFTLYVHKPLHYNATAFTHYIYMAFALVHLHSRITYIALQCNCIHGLYTYSQCITLLLHSGITCIQPLHCSEVAFRHYIHMAIELQCSCNHA